MCAQGKKSFRPSLEFVGNRWLKLAWSLPFLVIMGHAQLSTPEENVLFLNSALLWDILEEIPIYFTLYSCNKNIGI